jgi:hypothetical protein
MRQQVFEFLKAPAQKLPIALEDAIRRELVERLGELMVAVWREGRRSGDERNSDKR